MGRVGTLVFIVCAAGWEIAVGIIYGLFFSYNETAFTAQEKVTNTYAYASTSGSTASFQADTSQFPFPLAVVAIAIVLLIVGTCGWMQGFRWWRDTSSVRRLPAWRSRC